MKDLYNNCVANRICTQPPSVSNVLGLLTMVADRVSKAQLHAYHRTIGVYETDQILWGITRLFISHFDLSCSVKMWYYHFVSIKLDKTVIGDN